MRLGIISDMHGNAVAMHAALKDLYAHQPDKVVCLGDAVQGGPQPAEVVSILRDRNIPTVMGNSDAWLLEGFEIKSESLTPERRERLDKGRLWSLSQLNEDDKMYIRNFSPTIEMKMGGKKLLCFHGSPVSFDEILLTSDPEDKLAAALEPYEADLYCGGHTHTQFVRQIGESVFFNPGSVGVVVRSRMPKNQVRLEPWAEYAILTLEDGRQSLDFQRVPFDVGALISAYEERNHPHAARAAEEYGFVRS